MGIYDRPAGSILYPDYELTASILNKEGVIKDFETTGPIRYTHRTSMNWDIYFVSNYTNQKVIENCIFRSGKGQPQLWDPLTGQIRALSEFSRYDNGSIDIPLEFEGYQSFFIVFANNDGQTTSSVRKNFPAIKKVFILEAPWRVSFDPIWGGLGEVVFDSLSDWTIHPDKGIKYYSGIAVYQQKFNLSTDVDTGENNRVFLDLGKVNNMAHVWLNGKDLGVVWTAPWRVDITNVVKQKNNHLKMAVANLWPNRMIGDAHLPYDGIVDGKFPEWILKGEKRNSGRYAFTTNNPYNKSSSLLPSGLLGSVTIQPATYK